MQTLHVTSVELVDPPPSPIRQSSKHKRPTTVRILRDQLSAVFLREHTIDREAVIEVKARPRPDDDAGAVVAPTFEPLPFTTCQQSSVATMRPLNYRPLNGKPTDIPVPTSSEALTAAWCTQAFRARGYLAGTESVTKVALKPLGEGEGEFSELVLLNIEVDGAAPRLARQLVAKFSPPSMSDVELALTFGSEAHFYNDMSVAAGGLVRPEALYVGYLKRRCGKDGFCIIMESAAGQPGGAPAYSYKRVDGCGSPEHMMLVMRALARFHAHWWGSSQKHALLKSYIDPERGGGPLPPLPPCAARHIGATFIKSGLKALVLCFSEGPGFEGAPKFAVEYAPLIDELRPVLRRRRLAVRISDGAARGATARTRTTPRRPPRRPPSLHTRTAALTLTLTATTPARPR